MNHPIRFERSQNAPSSPNMVVLDNDITTIRELIDRMAETCPEAPFLMSPETGELLSFLRLKQQSAALSTQLQEWGLERCDKVAFLMDNSLFTAQLFLGAMYGGFVSVPLNVRAGVTQLRYMVEHCDAKVMFVGDEYTALMTEVMTEVRRPVRVIPADTDGIMRDAPSPATSTVLPAPEDIALLMYTSGSTGHPKAAVHTHQTILAGGRNSVAAHQLTSDDRSLLVLPVYHINAECVTLIPTLLSGGSVVVPHHFSISHFWDWLDEYECTWSAIVPTIVSQLLDWHDPKADQRGRAFQRIRFLRSSSAPLAPSLHREFLSKFPLLLIQAMGSSEGGNIFSNPLPPGENKIGSPGIPWGFEIKIVDLNGVELPNGEPGEMLIRGEALTSAYYKEPEATAAAFDADGWLHTGDLAYCDPDGYFFVVGRSKELIIKGGVNIAPRQIDDVLESHPAVLEAAAVGIPDRHFGEDVVAFVVLRTGTECDERELLGLCEGRLGHFKTPTRIYFVQDLPKGPSGKVQRLRLVVHATRRDGDVLAAAPTGFALGRGSDQDAQEITSTLPASVEGAIADIWADVLKLPQVGVDDNFFALGGDSLKAIQCISQLRERTAIRLTITEFFGNGTVAEQAALIRGRHASSHESDQLLRNTSGGDPVALPAVEAESAAQAIPVRDRSLPYQISPLQERLWFMERLNLGEPAYNEVEAVRLCGDLNINALEQAMNTVVGRHEVLRTTIHTIDGRAVAKVRDCYRVRLKVVDISAMPATDRESEIQRLLTSEPRIPYHLEEEPAIRATLIRMGANEHLFILMMHHLICDWSSLGVFWRELSAVYRSNCRNEPVALPALSLQYGDYAVWARQQLTETALADDLAFWVETLRGAPLLLDLPSDRPRPQVVSYRGARQRFCIDRTLTEVFRRLSREERRSLFALFTAALDVLLHRYTGQEDILIGVPISERDRPGFQSIFGFLLHTHVLRTHIPEDMTFLELVARVQQGALELYEHRSVPFDQVVHAVRPERSVSYSPLFQVMVNWRDRDQQLCFIGLEGLHVESVLVDSKISKFDLTLFLTDMGEEIWAEIEYSTDLFDPASIERMFGHYQTILEAVAVDPEQRVSDLPLLTSPEERQLLVEWNDTKVVYPACASIHESFEVQASQTPGQIALVSGQLTLSYQDLNYRANQVAHYLKGLGIGPNVLVGLCAKRSLDMVVGLLGILKAGAAYVPIDPTYPKDRLRYILEDSKASVVLTQEALLDGLPSFTGQAICFDKDWIKISRESERNLVDQVDPENLAYVLFTSGSTGKPKGVEISHRAVINFLNSMREAPGMEVQDTLLSVTTLSFDIFGLELWLPLTSGAKVVIASEETARDGKELAALIRQNGVTVMQATPSTWRLLLESGWEGNPHLKILCGGEAWPDRLAEQLLPKCAALWNMYGPTETTIWSSVHRIHEGMPVSIGHPIANTEFYVVDSHLHPVPVGVPGELLIGGAGLACGYLKQPELTAEKFIHDRFNSNAASRLYRTGDLVRYRPNGTLEFLGRIDHQVKIRGFRIELGEIETVLERQPGIRQCVVVLREADSGDQRLMAYIVPDDPNQAPALQVLRNTLKNQLPAYMIPAAISVVNSLPLTPNGKVDRKALSAPGVDAFVTGIYEGPQGEIEKVLASIWAEVLQLEQVGRHDNFFALGGHSLLAVQIITRIQWALNREVALNTIFAHPVLSDLAGALQSAERVELPPVTRAGRSQQLALSFAQQRLWFLAKLEEGSTAYHIPLGLRLRGKLNRAALRSALDRIVLRHEALRTMFHLEGEPVQRIAAPEESRFHLLEHDLSGYGDPEVELERLAGLEAGAAFDLEAGPLIRGRLICLREDEHVLLITMHHIVSDGWSLGVLTKELGDFYDCALHGVADRLPALEIQYADYAIWQRNWMKGETLRQQAAYWKDTLSGAPELLELPTDHLRPATQDYTGGFVELKLNNATTAALKDLSRRHGVTLYITLLAAWAAMLSRLSGQQEVVIGTPVANRSRLEIENLIGFFVNTLALRIDLSGSPTVEALLERIRTQALAGQRHQDIPFEQVVQILQPVRSLAHSPLFQVMFNWQHKPPQKPELPGIDASFLELGSHAKAKFDLTLSLADEGGCISGGLQFAAALFERSTAERYLGYFLTLLEAMAADDHRVVDDLPLLTSAERHRLLYAWNDTTVEYPSDKYVHQLFEEQADKTPDATAVVFQNQQLSYAELNCRSNRLAHYLRRLGVKPDDRVAICVERTFEMIVALLAVLKAGGAYVPLDPIYPEERLKWILSDSTSVALITQTRLRALFRGLDKNLPVVDLDAPGEWSGTGVTNLEYEGIHLSSQHLAYVIYTSGSTGLPKGVLGTHGGMLNRLHWMWKHFPFLPDEIGAAKTSLSFVDSFWEVKDTGRLIQELEHGGITRIVVVPSLLRAILDSGLSAGRRLRNLNLWVSSGEELSPELVRRFHQTFPGACLLNLYGSSEVAADCTFYQTSKDVAARVPIGRPIANTRIYILDIHGEPVPVGVAGELYIGGAGVARGYLNRPELTAEKFLKDPFVDEPGARMYRSGDLGRWLPDGNIEYLGRHDFQVKIRGFRIELGEIEAQLAAHRDVHEAVVVAREDTPGDKRLVAYYTSEEGEFPIAEELRSHLLTVLPDYMVPAAYVGLDRLPLTPNGKLDRRALPTPNADSYSAHVYEPPQGEVEEKLGALWAEVLQLERVGRHDDFFALGGHSLLVIKLFGQIERVFYRSIPIAAIFGSPTIEQLATLIRGSALDTTASQVDSEKSSIAKNSAVFPIQSGSSAPLFIIHGAQGHIIGFQQLAALIGTDHPVYGIQAQAFVAGEPGLLRVEDHAAYYLSEIRRIQPKGPYWLLGYCYGGIVAFEMAQQLHRLGEDIEFLGMLESRQRDSILAVQQNDSIRKRFDARFEGFRYIFSTLTFWGKATYLPKRLVARCRRWSYRVAHSVGVRSVPSFMKDTEEILKLAAQYYRPQPWDGRVTLFRASLQPDPRFPRDLGWAPLAKGGVEVCDVPGDHWSVIREPYIFALAEQIRKYLVAKPEAA
jgi:amino acid adenylation domain-containing protein